MDKLTFIAELVKAGVWPATVIAILVIFRGQIKSLLSRLRKGRLWSAEFDFEGEVAELALKVLMGSDEVVGSRDRDHFAFMVQRESLTQFNPRAALLEAWSDIEAGLTELARKHDLVSPKTMRSFVALVRALVEAGVFPKRHAPALIELFRIRNEASHDMEFDPSENALRGYLEIVERMRKIIMQAISEAN